MTAPQLLETDVERSPEISDPWLREAGLLSSVVTGFVDRAKQAFSPDHIATTGVEVAAVSGVAAALRIMNAAARPWKTVATQITYGLLGLTGLDVLNRLGKSGLAALDAWQSPKNYERDKQVVAENIGAALFDYPLMSIGVFGGYRAPIGYARLGQRLSDSAFTPKLQALLDGLQNRHQMLSSRLPDSPTGFSGWLSSKLTASALPSPDGLSVREFKVVKGDDVGNLIRHMKMSETASGELTLRERLSSGKLGPELRTLVQHFGGPNDPPLAINLGPASKADLVITCHPDLLGKAYPDLSAKHVFPGAKGPVLLEEGRIRFPFLSRLVSPTLFVFAGADAGASMPAMAGRLAGKRAAFAGSASNDIIATARKEYGGSNGPPTWDELVEQSFSADLFESRWARRAVLDEAQQVLAAYPDAGRLSGETALEAQLLADLVNHGAKVHDSGLYDYKPYLVRLALELGADGGWEKEGVFTLFTRSGGESSFHDPHGQLEAMLTNKQNALVWEHPWSGVDRQPLAYELIQSYLGDGRALRRMAYATTPGNADIASVRRTFGNSGLMETRRLVMENIAPRTENRRDPDTALLDSLIEQTAEVERTLYRLGNWAEVALEDMTLPVPQADRELLIRASLLRSGRMHVPEAVPNESANRFLRNKLAQLPDHIKLEVDDSGRFYAYSP
jgi:hypothetical protein